MSAAAFLHHRQSALYHFKLAEGADADAAAARHHLRSALSLASEALGAVAVDIPSERENGKAGTTSLTPLVATASALAKCLASLNAKTDVLFDPELAYWEQQLATASEIFSAEFSSSKAGSTSGDVVVSPVSTSSGPSLSQISQYGDTCAACGSAQELEADIDSPGTYYCVPCWVAYDNSDFDSTAVATEDGAARSEAGTAAATATLDNAVESARARGIVAYSVSELLALQTAHSAPLDADPACLLGHSDVTSVNEMLACLPQPRPEKSSGPSNSARGGGGGGGGGGNSKGTQRKRNAQKKEEERQVKLKEDACVPGAEDGTNLPSESAMANNESRIDAKALTNPAIPVSVADESTASADGHAASDS